MLTVVTRILMTTHVPPRPTIEAARLHMGDVIRNQVVPQSIPFIDRTPQLSARVDGQSHSIADSISKYAHSRAVRPEGEYVCTIFFARSSVRVIDIRSRTNGDVHDLPIG